MLYVKTLTAALVALGLLFSVDARGAGVSPGCPEPSIDDAENKELAKVWFAKGETLVQEELFAEAVGAFACSLRMVEHPATYMNAALAAEKAGDKATALRYFKRHVELDPNGKRAPEARAKVAALEIELAPAPDADDEQAHEKAQEAPELEPTVAPEPAREETPSVDGGGRPPLAVAGYTMIAVGAAGLVVGAVLQGLAGAAQSDGEETDSYADFKDHESRMESMQTGAIVSFAVGGSLAVAGIVMAIAGKRKGERENTAGEVAFVPFGRGIALEGSF